MIRDIGPIIARRRSEKGISQKELASRLRLRGIDITNQAVSKWENGVTSPNAVQFIAVCQVLGINDIIGEFCTGTVGGVFSGLNRRGRELAVEYISLLRLSEKYADTASEPVRLRRLPLYSIAASAGTGQFLDSSDYELVEVNEDVPENANFGVRLAGDSMEPRFFSGDVVWVSQSRALESGEIGIFLWDGNVYCKRLDKSDGKLRLVSLNKRYVPIEISGEKDFRVFGRVVGKWNTGI